MSTVPAFLHALVDDAAVFPPGEAPLDEAVAAHREHLRSPYAPLLGPLVVADAMLPDPALDGDPLRVSVVVSGGAGALEPAVAWATRAGGVGLAGLEIALRDSATGEVAHNARRIVTAVDRLVASGDLDEDVVVHVEPPRLRDAPPTPDWLAALDELAAADVRLKLRTGGLEADAFPSAEEVAAFVGAALDRELPFKCTAGLHHALRHRDATTGFEHHGFLGVLLATRAALDGASPHDVAAALDETDAAAVLDALGAAGETGLTSARRWFTGFGSCSVRDPLDDLTELGLVTR